MILPAEKLDRLQATLAYVRSGEPDLTYRQMAVMMLVAWQGPQHTVRGLAKTLGVQKPVITRALNTLGGLGFIRRVRDDADRRNVWIIPQPDGVKFLARVVQ